MTFYASGNNFWCTANYKILSDDGLFFQCLLQSFNGKTCFDKAPEELMLYKHQGKWKSEQKAYKELALSLGAAIELYLLTIGS